MHALSWATRLVRPRAFGGLTGRVQSDCAAWGGAAGSTTPGSRELSASRELPPHTKVKDAAKGITRTCRGLSIPNSPAAPVGK